MRLLLSPGQIGRTLKNAARFRVIVGTFAKYGFQDVAERVHLGRFVPRRFRDPEIAELSAPERMRLCFEELGPTFVKLGQVLATRPDLVPPIFADEFKKLHDQVSSLPFDQLEPVLNEQFGDYREIFRRIESSPLAAASIAQVHEATLQDGTQVVLKIQRPHIERQIDDDIHILYFLADLIEKNFPEARSYNLSGIVDEFFKTLELETNFLVEGNNLRRIAENFEGDPNLVIPKVYLELSGRKLLVMERLDGIPLSQKGSLEQGGVSREDVVLAGVRAFFKMVFKDGLFHGDLHAGNLFILKNGRIGLVDFGMVGHLSRKTQDSIANMFVALAKQDYDRLAYEYIDLAPYNDETNVDAFARDLRNLLAPYFGLTLKNLNLGRLLMDSTAVAARHRVALPSELVLYFKSIVTIEGMGRQIIDDFDLMNYVLEFANELVSAKYDREKILGDLLELGRESTSLLYSTPRYLKQVLRRWSHPGAVLHLEMKNIDSLRRSVDNSANIVFLGLIIGSLILTSGLTLEMTGPRVLGIPTFSLMCLLLASGLSLLAFINYIRK